MKFSVAKATPQSFKTELVAIGLFERSEEESEGKKKHALIKHIDGGIDLDRALGGEISKQIAAECFTGAKGTSRLLFTTGRIPARFVLLVGMGPRTECNLEVLRAAGSAISRACNKASAESAALVLERGSIDEMPAANRARAIAEGTILGAYRFDKYKTDKEDEKPRLTKTTFLYQGDAGPVREAVEIGRIVAEAQNIARDLVNTPGIDATPKLLAAFAKKMAAGFGLKCNVLASDAIKRERMNGLLAVSRGSAEPPSFIILTYKPKDRSHGHVALIGKGITFDAGGLSLKPPRQMEDMKSDMAGAASVIAAMQAIAQLKPAVQVSAFVAASENLPDGKAIKPGDIIKMRNGKTVEIINADAEGRLVVADGLSYAVDKKPDAIVDLATLTGGAAYCCGELYSIVLGSDQKLVDKLKRSAEATGEPIWQLPMVEEYKKGYTSGIADLNNNGKSKAQTILGALFLREFVDDTPWAHLDIAASSWTDESLPTCPKGATGIAVRTIVDFVCGFKKG
ncbi:MAG: leucyl aminopeptidase [Pseudomonadota bacterium]